MDGGGIRSRKDVVHCKLHSMPATSSGATCGLKGLPYVHFLFYLGVFVNKENIKAKLKHVSLASSIPNPTSASEFGQ
jgi:hypothetical protein